MLSDTKSPKPFDSCHFNAVRSSEISGFYLALAVETPTTRDPQLKSCLHHVEISPSMIFRHGFNSAAEMTLEIPVKCRTEDAIKSARHKQRTVRE